jgi:hypothetical protein
MGDVSILPARVEPDAELLALARRRLKIVVLEAETTTTLDSVLQRLFDRDHRELLTYSAFGSAL